MARDPQEMSTVYRMDVSPNTPANPPAKPARSVETETSALLKMLVEGQRRQNELLEELVEQMGAAQRQRAAELGQWREANPVLARRCRAAAEVLSQVQTEFLENLTIDVKDNFESLLDGEFMLNEFVDRYGPRLAHLNGVLQVLSQLSSAPHPASNEV
ncbi:MAG TPA: hypothetical protein PKD54_12230 [Pirellulaceae bacterium]|nr:hypothetical protein [Pirellulaceae bacterium]